MEIPKLSLPHISKNQKKLTIIILGLLFILIIVIILINSSIQSNHRKRCRELFSKTAQYTDDYMKTNQLYPVINGTSYTVDLAQIEGSIYFGDKIVSGTVRYTKYNDQYIKTFELVNCSYCEANWKKETDKYQDKDNIDVIPTFNYYDVSYNNSKWSNWIDFDNIATEATDGVYLPKDSKNLPAIPSEAITQEIVKEDKPYYRYRDKQWKYYRNNIAYSSLSSEQPAGYANKDTATETSTEATDWSLNYPEEKSYRNISTKTGYRWYYEENGEKIYWNDGSFSPIQPSDQYAKKSKEKANMYSYVDKMWKWYNGDTKRQYSNYTNNPNRGYNYKDEDLIQYTSWSDFMDVSKVTSGNNTYREEQMKTYSRYLIKYKVLSFAKFPEFKTLADFQMETGKTLLEMNNDNSVFVEVHFKFRY